MSNTTDKPDRPDLSRGGGSALLIGCLKNLAISDNTDVLSTNFMANMIPYPRLECFDVIDGKYITAFDKRNPEMLLLKPIKISDIKYWVYPKFKDQSFYLIIDRFITSKGNKRQYITKKWAEAVKEVRFPKENQVGCIIGMNTVHPTEVFTVTKWDTEKMILNAKNFYGEYMNIPSSNWIGFIKQLQNE